jgi:hypothetical protein
MKKSLFLILAFVIGMIMTPQHDLHAGNEPPGVIYSTPSQASSELLAQVGTDSQVEKELNKAITEEEEAFHQAQVKAEDASPPSKGINWAYLIPAVIGILEIIFRLVPTSISITPLSLLYQILGRFIPDRSYDDKSFTVQKE